MNKESTLLAGELKEVVRNIELSARAANHYLAMHGVGAYSPVKLADDLKDILASMLVRLNELAGSTNNQLSKDGPASVIQRLNDIGQAVECARGAMTSELDALAKDVVSLRDTVELYDFRPYSPCLYNVRIGVVRGNADADEIKNAVLGFAVKDIEQLDSELRTAEPFNHRFTGTIHLNDAPITGGTLTGDEKSFVGHSPFKFALGEAVELELTGERGKVTSRAEHLNASNQYLVVYAAGGGRGRQEAWLEESEINAVPVDPEK